MACLKKIYIYLNVNDENIIIKYKRGREVQNLKQMPHPFSVHGSSHKWECEVSL